MDFNEIKPGSKIYEECYLHKDVSTFIGITDGFAFGKTLRGGAWKLPTNTLLSKHLDGFMFKCPNLSVGDTFLIEFGEMTGEKWTLTEQYSVGDIECLKFTIKGTSDTISAYHLNEFVAGLRDGIIKWI